MKRHKNLGSNFDDFLEEEKIEIKDKVIFRKWKDTGDVIAIFPEIPGNFIGHCMSYERVGQHGVCCPPYVIESTKPCTPDEYHSLMVELESIGYRLEVRQRYTQQMVRTRKRNMPHDSNRCEWYED